VRDLLSRAQKQVLQLRKLFGVVVPPSELIALVTDPESQNLGEWSDPLRPSGKKILYLAKHVIQRTLPNFHLALEVFPRLPPHTMISVDLVGDYPRGEIETYLLEASLYEDMAGLWNLTWRQWKAHHESAPKAESKPILALNRATAKAAFNFLEGYLNGLALDIQCTMKVSPNDRIRLQEWDDVEDRPRHQSLRNKLIGYPRIATGKHPPDDLTCPAIQRVVELEHRIRHSLIHPTPRVPHGSTQADREMEFRNLSFDQVGNLCDDVIETILTIDHFLAGQFGSVTDWLIPRRRGEDFDDAVFF